MHQVLDLHGEFIGLVEPVLIEQANCRAQLVLSAFDLFGQVKGEVVGPKTVECQRRLSVDVDLTSAVA